MRQVRNHILKISSQNFLPIFIKLRVPAVPSAENPRQIGISAAKSLGQVQKTHLSHLSQTYSLGHLGQVGTNSKLQICPTHKSENPFIYKAFRSLGQVGQLGQAKNNDPEKLLSNNISIHSKINRPVEKRHCLVCIFCNKAYPFSSISTPLCLILALLEQTQRGCIYISKEHIL